MSVFVAIFGIVIVCICLYLINKSKLELLYSLPILIVLLEIINVLLREFGLGSGVNGLYFILLSFVVISNFKYKVYKIVVFYYVLILFLIGLLAININPETSLFNNISRIGNFALALSIVPVYYNNSLNIDHSKIYNKIIKTVYIYTGFIVFSSITKFGPNHYDTGLVYGFMFEQWYFGALAISLFPVLFFKNNISRNKYYINHIIFVVLLILILLVLRRTIWLMLILTLLLYILFSGIKKSNIKRSITVLLFIIPISLLFALSGVWDIRGDRSIASSVENIESEGRYIEYIMVYYTLEKNNNILFGYKSAFDETGKYNHPREERSMHGSYSRILFGSGITGLMIYIIILMSILGKLIKIRMKINNDEINLILSSFIVYLFVALTGASGIGLGSSYVIVLFITVGIVLKKYNSV